MIFKDNSLKYVSFKKIKKAKYAKMGSVAKFPITPDLL